METTLAPTQLPVMTAAQQNTGLPPKVEEHVAQQTAEINSVNALHNNAAPSNTLALKQSTAWDKLTEAFYNAPPWFQWFRKNFSLYLNYFGIAFNTVAVIGTNSPFFGKETAKFLDEKSEWFSKYIIPFSFGWNGVEAIMGKRLPEAFSRLIPAVLFNVLPFYNLNLATGVSSWLNYLFELVKDRHGGKNPCEGNVKENAKEVFKTSIEIFKSTFKGDQSKENWFRQMANLCLLVGSFGGLTFASKSRDSTLARIFGNMRNIGGFLADWELIRNNDSNQQRAKDLRTVGGSCGLASILNILMRWVDPKLARSLNHIAIAADDFGLTYWAQGSQRDNDLAQKAKLAAKAASLHKTQQNTIAKTLAV